MIDERETYMFDLSGETDAEVAAALAISSPEVEYTPTSLVLRDGLDFNRWQEIGGVLQRMERSIRWWIGDWLAYGERVYGETYAQAVEVTGRKVQDLMDMAWVSSHVEISNRNENLSWSHHRQVAALPPAEQAEQLAAAERDHLSVSKLRARIAGPEAGPKDEAVPTCRRCGHPCRWCDVELKERGR